MLTIDPAISLSLAFALAALLGAAGVHKAQDYPRFVGVLRNYRLFPAPAVPVIAAIVIISELAIAAALLAPMTRAQAAAGAAALFAAYGGAIAINIARGRTAIDCGCSFGDREGELLSQRLLWRNALLTLAALVLLAPVGERSLVWVDWATALLFAAGAAAIYLGVETLAAVAATAKGVRRI